MESASRKDLEYKIIHSHSNFASLLESLVNFIHKDYRSAHKPKVLSGIMALGLMLFDPYEPNPELITKLPP
jgi:hypothetical protein